MAIRIENNIKVLEFLCGIEDMCLSDDNRKTFKEIFGKRDGTFKGEFFHHFWNIDYKGYVIRIYTAKDKGTSYEISNYDGTFEDYRKDNTASNIIIEFLEELKNKIIKNK